MAPDDVKMIQVHGPTHERLTALKLPGLTYEDVINYALDGLTPAQIQHHYEAWQKEALAKLQRVSRQIKASKS